MNSFPQSAAPFGIATKRFAKMGFHPELDVSGAMKREVTKCGPGSYNPVLAKCRNLSTKEVWRRKLASEVWSKNLGYNLPEILATRKFETSMGGPAVTTVDEAIFQRKSDMKKKNRGFGYQKRFFKSKNEDNNPPPDTYYRDVKKLNTAVVEGFTEMPHFLWDCKPRFKDEVPSHHIGPAHYDVKDHDCIEVRTTTSTSNRRPLEFFTRERNYKTIKNHFGPGNVKEHETFIIPDSDIEYLLHNPAKKRCGKFLMAERWLLKPVVRELLNDYSLCYRDPKHPGPGTYDTQKFKSIKKADDSRYPFDSSNTHPRPKTDWTITPGVGRFTPKRATCRYKAHKRTFPFTSTSKRGSFSTTEDYYAF